MSHSQAFSWTQMSRYLGLILNHLWESVVSVGPWFFYMKSASEAYSY